MSTISIKSEAGVEQPKAPPEPLLAAPDTQIVKIPRRSIPGSMKYDDYIAVYRSLLQWIATIKLTEEPESVRKAEQAFLGDHAKLQKCVLLIRPQAVQADCEVHLDT